MVKKTETYFSSAPGIMGGLTTVTTEVLPDEGAAAAGGSLESLARQAEDLGSTEPADPAAPGAVQEAPPKVTNGQMLTGALIMIRDVYCGVTGFQSPKTHMGDKEAAALGEAWGAVADKRGLDLQAIVGDYSAEFAAVMVTVPIALAIRTGVQADMAARDKALAEKGGSTSSQAPLVTDRGATNAQSFTEGVVRPTFKTG